MTKPIPIEQQQQSGEDTEITRLLREKDARIKWLEDELKAYRLYKGPYSYV